MHCIPIMEGMGSANGGPSPGATGGAAMVTWPVRILCLTSRSRLYRANWLEEAKGEVHGGDSRGCATVGNLYVFRPHEFFIDNNSE